MNLIEGLHEELKRNREILVMYKEIPAGVFGATMIQAAINRAEKSISDGDTVAMLVSLGELKETE